MNGWGVMNKNDLKGILAGCIVSGVVGLYFGISYYYDSFFCPNTYVNGIEISEMTVEDAKTLLEMQNEAYALRLITQDGNANLISGEKIDYEYNFDMLDALKKKQMGWSWIYHVFNKTDHEIEPEYMYDEKKVKACVDDLPCMNMKMIAPMDASVKVDTKGMHLKEEIWGSTLNKERVLAAVQSGLSSGAEQIDLDEQGCYDRPKITMESEEIQSVLKKIDAFCDAKITYEFQGKKEVIGKEQIRKWVRSEDGEKYYISWQAAYDYLRTLSDKYDTINKYRDFKSSRGTVVSVPPGNYGWAMNVSIETDTLIDDIYNHRKVSRVPNYYMTPYDYLDEKATDDIGFTYVEIDLSSQHMWYYENKELILETPITSGTMATGYGTPAGVYYIYNRIPNALLIGDDYRTPVNYWMQVNGGIGIHDALWRSTYGGTEYLYNGSHGCINTPFWAVEQLFNRVNIGTPVILYY